MKQRMRKSLFQNKHWIYHLIYVSHVGGYNANATSASQLFDNSERQFIKMYKFTHPVSPTKKVVLIL